MPEGQMGSREGWTSTQVESPLRFIKMQRGNTSVCKMCPRHQLFKAVICRKYLLILLPRHWLLATAGGGIWDRKDICTHAAQPLLCSHTSSGSHPLLSSIPLHHRRFPPHQLSWTLNDWALTEAMRMAAVGWGSRNLFHKKIKGL